MLAIAEPIRRSDSKVAVEERQDTRGVEDESDQDLEREAKEIDSSTTEAERLTNLKARDSG